ncbi:hypothetical protein ISF26_18730 [Gloeobacter morelensis MG652769]|uniref:Uncharacterized protein n=2 Tax=Gloeobacter TaxID=33071 RepID=A0ABY3PJF2_9CYAN|nr:hypothetical protein ISF26_18730 [Gloeobacter morelensis MG652769]
MPNKQRMRYAFPSQNLAGAGMQKIHGPFRAALGAVSCALVLTLAAGMARAQGVSDVSTATVEPLGMVDVRSIPEPEARETIRIIRRPLSKLSGQKRPAPLATADVPFASQGEAADPISEAAANLLFNFEGIEASNLEPPDPHVAVGPSEVLLATNAGLRVYNKSGSPITGLLSPSSFFGVPSQFEIQSDPKVLYDAASGRFFAVWIAFDQQANLGAWFVAVSTSSSASGTFFRYQINETGNLPDYPGLGICSDKLVITANDFRPAGFGGFSFTGAVAVALNKSQLTSGSSVSLNRFGNIQLSGGAGQAFTIQPAQSLTSTSSCNMVSLRGTNGIQLYKINGLPPSATLSTSTTVPSLTTAVTTPVDATQPGTTRRVDTGDTRLLDATYRGVNGGSIWTSSNTGCRFSGSSTTFTCINVVELSNVDGGSPSRRQQIVFGASGLYYYFPALRTDSANNMTVVFSRSGSSEFPGVRYTSHLNAAALNTLESSVSLIGGSAAYTGTRWGDYFGAALDPTDNRSIWIYGEYKRTGSSLWHTRVGQTQVP